MPTRQPTPKSPAPPHIFYFGPFRFESEIDVPELHTSRGSGERPVTIRLGGVPRTIDNAVPDGADCQVALTEYLLDVPGTARYYARNGNEVRVEIAPHAPISDVSIYLLGSVFGALCHQNGLLPLHASAVEHPGGVVAFLGDSGAGKSTLAACLQRRGHRIVSDDICLLEPDAANTMRVVPVAGWLKLWSQSLQHLGETPDEQNRVFSTDDKYRHFLESSESPASALQSGQLSRVVFLGKHPDPASGAQPTLELLPTPDAIAALMDMTYAAYVPALTGQQSRVFRQCARVFAHARAYSLTVPWGLDRIDAVLDLLEQEILTP